MRIKVWFVSLLTLFSIVIGSYAIAKSGENLKANSNKIAQSPTAKDSKLLDVIKNKFTKRFPGIDADKVLQSPMPSLFEVQIGTDVVYVDENVDFLIQGSMIDAKTRLDLTQQSIQKLSAVPFEKLPLDLAFKQVRGDGSRKIAIFEDPNCGYCKQLQKSLVDAENVTIYSFLYPILSEDSVVKTRNVLCSKEPSKAWYGWMVDGVVPPENQCEDHNIQELMDLGRKLSVRGTPAIFFEDGFRASGALPLAQIHEKLNQISK